MVPDEEPVPARLLGSGGDRRHRPRVGEVAEVRDVDREPHPSIMCPRSVTAGGLRSRHAPAVPHPWLRTGGQRGKPAVSPVTSMRPAGLAAVLLAALFIVPAAAASGGQT